MKVIFEGNETADVSAIRSVRKETIQGKLKVCVEHKTGEQKVSYLAYPRLRYARLSLRELAKPIAKELEELSRAPDMPIEKIIELDAWRCGHLQVKLDINNDASVRGLARLCWDWSFSQTPKYEQLEFRTGLRTDEIQKVTNTNIYKHFVASLMLKTYKTAGDFKGWVRDYGGNMPHWFGDRMRLSEDAARELINSVAERYSVDLGNLRRGSALFKSERTIGSGRESVYLYYYQWDRESAESKGEKVWECKIGRTKRVLQKRIREQATDTDKLRIGLHIKTDKCKEIEGIIQKILKREGKHTDKLRRTEWFLTSPSEVEEIYNFIGESS